MPPKASTESGQKVVPADCVSVLLMAIGSTTISKAQYEMMSALDGTRTASSFEHQFRTITAKAKELKARAEQGETFQPVAPAKKGGQTTPATSKATPKKRKDMSSGSEDATPSKKKTATPKSRGKKAQTVEDTMEEDFPDDAEEFIKREKKWEEDVFT
ncbi:uncharacterized protein J4E92_006518 [Alternaria infectoria]|uniref:uncharacterized protein n=1 Tax=Alternaria infectoria TaxID=45303 RepID=UPI00221F0162|nr:uncharacterized protein J4E92_006518 [Alternaria infectoria]KAI4708950.1 hypothetical protein J4E89_006352 [Alternaria sp. Ai002NY15]KAI4925782.1 hypothetical protein J4E92_006518 [Alternaria infectoria]